MEYFRVSLIARKNIDKIFHYRSGWSIPWVSLIAKKKKLDNILIGLVNIFGYQKNKFQSTAIEHQKIHNEELIFADWPTVLLYSLL